MPDEPVPPSSPASGSGPVAYEAQAFGSRALRSPEIPVSAGAIVLDDQGRLLVVKPSYKSGWTIPGGIMEATGETPWDACRREVFEEVGLVLEGGRLVCVDTRPAHDGRKLGLRFLFHCGALAPECVDEVTIDGVEIEQFRFARVGEALALLRKPVRRRVRHGLEARHCLYLENGRPVDAVC